MTTASSYKFASVFRTSGATFDENVGDVIDVDQWLRAFAFSTVTGHGDNYGAGSQHNAQFYVRPSDSRVLFLPHDLDAFFNVSNALVGNGDLRKLIRVPEREHMFYGHVHDMIQTTFNRDYMDRWGDHWRSLIPAQRFDRHVTDMQRRSDNLIAQIERAAPRVDFSASSDNEVVDQPFATISGNGWVNVREIRLAGSNVPLSVEWTSETEWRTDVPLALGMNTIVVQAFDFQGVLLDSKTVEITSTVANPVSEALVISEINYNPIEPTPEELSRLPLVEESDFEFVEITNRADVPVNALGVSFTRGIQYTFPAMILGPGESIVVVADKNAFEARYGTSIRVAGEFDDGKLSNSGERLTVQDSMGNTIADFVFSDNDPWPLQADGAGGTLELADPLTASTDSFSKYDAWFGSLDVGGTPGSIGDAPNKTVVINEILANSDLPDVDSIELYNTTPIGIDIGGWYLSDSDNNLTKFQIPDGTVIEGQSTIVFSEIQFNPTPQNPGPNHFALGSNGDQIWLTSVDSDGQIDRFIDMVDFGDTHTSRTLGRFPDGEGRLVPMSTKTLDASNSPPLVSPIVVTEIQYNPGDPSNAALAVDPDLTSDLIEFVELTNTSAAPIDLDDWRLRSAVEMNFDRRELGPGASVVVVPFSPNNMTRSQAFRIHYGIDDSVVLVGPYSNQLDNDWEKLLLQQAGSSAADGNLFALAEEVIYDDVSPWPTEADGTGNSISRVRVHESPNDGNNWVAATPTPGTTSSGQTPDINSDGVLDVDDVDLLCRAIHTGENSYDLDGNGRFDDNDVAFMIRSVFNTSFGDSNLDGIFNSSDLVFVFRAGEYEDELAGNSLWSEGDWNCDGEFDTSDLVRAFQDGGYVAAAFARSVDVDARIEQFERQQGPLAETSKRAFAEINYNLAPERMLVEQDRDVIFKDYIPAEFEDADTEMNDLGFPRDTA